MADNWHVVSQKQTSELTPAGQFIDVMEVYFDVNGVGPGTVRIPVSQYSAETVREQIDAQAATMLEVHAL